MHPVLQFLNSIYPLSPDVLDYLTIHIQFKELKKKEFLLKAGHVCDRIYFITEGLLRCYYTKNDTEISAWFMHEGDVIVSVQSFFQQQPSLEWIQALEDCELCYLQYDELQFAYRQFPELNFVGRVLTEKYYSLSEQRLQAMRLQRAHERFELLQIQYPQWLSRVPAVYLASYLGISEVWLSKIRSRFNHVDPVARRKAS